MSRAPLIPEDLFEEVLKRSGQGFTAAQTSKYLLEKHGIKVSRPSVSRLLKEFKEERAEAAKMAYSEAAASYANMDLRIVGSMIAKFSWEVENCLSKRDLSQANKLAMTLLQYIKTRLDLSGINCDTSNSENELAKVKEEWIKKLNDVK